MLGVQRVALAQVLIGLNPGSTAHVWHTARGGPPVRLSFSRSPDRLPQGPEPEASTRLLLLLDLRPPDDCRPIAGAGLGNAAADVRRAAADPKSGSTCTGGDAVCHPELVKGAYGVMVGRGVVWRDTRVAVRLAVGVPSCRSTGGLGGLGLRAAALMPG